MRARGTEGEKERKRGRRREEEEEEEEEDMVERDDATTSHRTFARRRGRLRWTGDTTRLRNEQPGVRCGGEGTGDSVVAGLPAGFLNAQVSGECFLLPKTAFSSRLNTAIHLIAVVRIPGVENESGGQEISILRCATNVTQSQRLLTLFLRSFSSFGFESTRLGTSEDGGH